jgi:AcrR family transcriptional regulator
MQYSNKREKTRKSIKDAFITLYKSKDAAHIKVKDICEMVDINRSTFYAHYMDVYELLAEIEDEAIDEMKGIMIPIFYQKEAEFDFNQLSSAVISILHRKDNLPILLIRRGNEDFVDRLMTFIDKTLQSYRGPLDPQTEKKMLLCNRYHITGVAAVLNYEEQVDSAEEKDRIENVVSVLAEVASKGVITVARESIID